MMGSQIASNTAPPRARSKKRWAVSLSIGGLVVFTTTFGGLALPPQGTEGFLDRYDLSADAGVQVNLPRALREISGLATTSDGRLFAHNDERAVVFEIDLESWEVSKAFSVGLMGTPGDFEGIAAAGDRFFLLASTGQILEFREGRSGATVNYRIHDTRLGRICELEGLAADLAREELLLPCKNPRTDHYEDHIVVFSVSLGSLELNPNPRVVLPLKELEEEGLNDKFHPAAVEIDPQTGAIILIAAREEVILELSSTGELLAARELKKKTHPQPEGVAVLSDGTLVLADEGQGKRGTLTRYRPIPGAGEGSQ